MPPKAIIPEVTNEDDEEEEEDLDEDEEEEKKVALPPVKPSKEKEVKPMK